MTTIRGLALAILLVLLFSIIFLPLRFHGNTQAVVVDDGTLSDWDNVTVTFTDPLGDSPIDMTDLVFVAFDFDDIWLYVRWDIDNDGTKPAVLYDMGINISASGTTWDIFVAAQIERVAGTPVLTNISIRDALDAHIWNATDDGSMVEDGTLYFDPPPGGTPGTISVEARFPLASIDALNGLIFSQFRSHSSIQVTSNVKDAVPDTGYIVLSLDDNPPWLANLTDFPDPQSLGVNVNITVDAMDDYFVESAWVNITFPDSSWMNTSMVRGNGNEWYLNTSYLEPGVYTYTAWANDSSNNWNFTGPETFTITGDTVLPQLDNLVDTPDPQLPGGNVNITVDVTDDIAVDQVWVNITYPDSSWLNVSMNKGNGDEWFYNDTFSDLGIHSYTVWANDTSDKWNSTGPGNFTIQDTDGPVFANLDVSPDPQENGGNVNITVDVTDNVGISMVWVNISYPDSSWNNVSMNKGAGDKWYHEAAYADLGAYSYTIWANDTSDNWNSSGPGTFTIQDTDGPVFANLDVSPDPQENGGNVNITVDVTDDVGLDEVWVNITYPDSSWVNVSMSKGAADEWFYETTYNDLGSYTYTVWANDTSDNWNSAGPGTFTVQDTDGPVLANLDDIPDPQENGGSVNITVDATDDVGVDEVWVNITYPDSSWTNISMSKGIANEWFYETTYNDLGIYSYTVWANDTSNNWNNAGPGTFVIQDTDGPILANLDDTPDPQVNGGNVNITLDVTDDVAVDEVWINITYPDSSWINVSMNKGSGDEWFYETVYNDLGVYSYTVWANDTSDNWNNAGPGTFTIQDLGGPVMVNLEDTPDPQENGGNVNITVDVTDGTGVDGVWVNITYPDSSWVNVSMNKGNGNEWFYETTYNDLGVYSYSVWANDTSDNWNNAGPGTFTIQDTDGPEFSNLDDAPDPQENDDYVNISVEVTDDVGVDSVWVNISNPDGSFTNSTMVKGSGNEWFHNVTFSDLGFYSYTIWANDTSDNWNFTINGGFKIQDTDGPQFSSPNDTPDPQEYGGNVNVTVDISDDVGIDGVWINITYPDGSYINVSMSPGTGNDWFYNSTYSVLGLFSYTVWANDTSDNWNSTSPETFTIQDATGPDISNLADSPDPQQMGGFVNISVDVTDLVGVGEVWINITYPNGTSINTSMTKGTGDGWFINSTFMDSGIYSYAVWANDTSDNWNFAGPGSFEIKGDINPPELSNLLDFPDPQDPGDFVNITVDVTDDIAVDGVWLNISHPDGSYTNISMNQGVGLEWIFNTTYFLPGIYIYTVWANDTSDNWNSTSPTTFTINGDSNPPQISNPLETPDPQDPGGNVNITIDITDDYGIGTVWVNISYPNGTSINSTMNQGSGDEWFFDTSYVGLGTYTYTIWANDTSGNWNSSTSETFDIIDSIPPEINNPLDTPDPQENGGCVNITVNIVDDIAVDTVTILITYPDTSSVNLTMDKGIGDEWYLELAYNDLGMHSYIIWANDTSNNCNSSSSNSFTIQDTDGPEFDNILDDPDPQMIGDPVNVSVDVTDDIAVSQVYINISYPNGTYINITMQKGTGVKWFLNSTYPDLGIHEYMIWANDSQGNWNYTTTSTFEIKTDIIPPLLLNATDVPDPQVPGGSVNITVEAVDDTALGVVLLNVTSPDGSWNNVSMVHGPGDLWYLNTAYFDPGIYYYTIWANDTSDNRHATAPGTFMIQDISGPEIENPFEDPNPQAVFGFVNISVEVTDNVMVNGVWIILTLPDSSQLNVSMTKGGGDSWYFNSSYTDTGIVSYRIWANDTSNNWNTTLPSLFLVLDWEPPQILSFDDFPDPQENGGSVNINTEISDNVDVDLVWVNMTHPDGSWINTTMDKGTGNVWFYNSTYPDVGLYDYTIWAKDTSDNWISAKPGSFQIVDTDGPFLSNLQTIPSIQTKDGFVNILIKVTDDLGVGEVWVNITYPDGNHDNITLGAGAGDIWFLNQPYATWGTYSFLIYASDTSSNWNSTGPASFEIVMNDDPPIIWGLSDYPDPQEFAKRVDFTVNVADDFGVTNVWLFIEYPNDTHVNVSMSKGTGFRWFYQDFYSILGDFSYWVWVEDSGGNWNFSGPRTFTIRDTIPPELDNLMDTPDPQENGELLVISLDVTDNVAVSSVWMNIRYPDGIWLNRTLSISNINKWVIQESFEDLGLYIYSISAIDTSGNLNTSSSQSFIVVDTDGPEIHRQHEIPHRFPKNEEIIISFYVTDDIEVDSVYIVITDPSGFTSNVTMKRGKGNQWLINSMFDRTGNYSYTIYAVDSSGNWNSSDDMNFVVEPEQLPTDIPKFVIILLLFIYWPLILMILVIAIVKRFDTENRFAADLNKIATSLFRYYRDNPGVSKPKVTGITDIISICEASQIPPEELMLTVFAIGNLTHVIAPDKHQLFEDLEAHMSSFNKRFQKI